MAMKRLTSPPTSEVLPSAQEDNEMKKEIQFYPEKGLGSYHFFGNGIPEDKGRKLYRVMVSQSAPYLSLPNAEEVLAIALPKGFVDDCKGAGWTLVEAMTAARDFYVEKAKSPKVKISQKKVDLETKKLAGILSGMAPEILPVKLLAELKDLIESKGEAAVEMLVEMEKDNGRDEKGYIYMRKVTKK